VRASDILETTVFDSDGRKVGQVHDIRIVREGPVQGLFGPTYVARGLIVGAGAVGVRLGFDRTRMAGPAVLRMLFRWVHRKARFVDWSLIESIEGDEIRIRVPIERLPEVPER
jgi:hypothetical protein